MHLPIGLLASVPVWDLAGLLDPAGHWWGFAFWSLLVGLVAAVPAAVTGVLDHAELPPESAAGRVATRHLYAAIAAVGCYGTSLALRGGPLPEASTHSAWAIAFSVVGAGFLGLTGWLGGELVFRHGIGRAGPGRDGVRDAGSGGAGGPRPGTPAAPEDPGPDDDVTTSG